jgi:hypothetical protein
MHLQQIPTLFLIGVGALAAACSGSANKSHNGDGDASVVAGSTAGGGATDTRPISSSLGSGGHSSAGTTGAGGATSTGSTTGGAGATGSSGAAGNGGGSGTAGSLGSGGTASAGGATGAGGTTGTGGRSGTAGSLGSGGTASAGGATGSGGGSGTAGRPGSGGTASAGGAAGTGGSVGSGGLPGSGGSGTGGAGGSVPNTGGSGAGGSGGTTTRDAGASDVALDAQTFDGTPSSSLDDCFAGLPKAVGMQLVATKSSADGRVRIRIALDTEHWVSTSGTFAWGLIRFGVEMDGAVTCITDRASLVYQGSHHNCADSATAIAGTTTYSMSAPEWEETSLTITTGGTSAGPYLLTSSSCAMTQSELPGTLKCRPHGGGC